MSIELADLKGVGEATIAKLHSVGIHTVEALAFITTKELEQVGILKEAPKIIVQAQEQVLKHSFVNAKDLLEKRKNVRKLTTGCKALDDLFHGGYETQNITEVASEFGGGKTQCALTAAVCAQLPEDQGGLDGGTLWIDTEETFRAERIAEIATARGLSQNEVLSRIITAPAFNSDHQQLVAERADEQIKKNNIRLIIVDSIMAHFRSEYIGREELPSRQQHLNQHLHQILHLARAFNAVALVTNQAIANPDGSPYAQRWFATGGNIMGHASGLRLMFRKAGANKRIATITDSSWLAWGESPFLINAKGIDDVPEAEDKKRGKSEETEGAVSS